MVNQEEQWARAAFYEKHNIAFVARPPMGRRGVFKKASNLNYQLAISDKIKAFMEEGLTHQQALLKVGWCCSSLCFRCVSVQPLLVTSPQTQGQACTCMPA